MDGLLLKSDGQCSDRWCPERARGRDSSYVQVPDTGPASSPPLLPSWPWSLCCWGCCKTSWGLDLLAVTSCPLGAYIMRSILVPLSPQMASALAKGHRSKASMFLHRCSSFDDSFVHGSVPMLLHLDKKPCPKKDDVISFCTPPSQPGFLCIVGNKTVFVSNYLSPFGQL